jgi:hypothetical protein
VQGGFVKFSEVKKELKTDPDGVLIDVSAGR